MRLVLNLQAQPEALPGLKALRRMGQQFGADLVGFDGGAQHLGLAVQWQKAQKSHGTGGICACAGVAQSSQEKHRVQHQAVWRPLGEGLAWKVALYTEVPRSIKMRACIPLTVFGPT